MTSNPLTQQQQQQPHKTGKTMHDQAVNSLNKNACEDFMPLSAEETLKLVHEVEKIKFDY